MVCLGQYFIWGTDTSPARKEARITQANLEVYPVNTQQYVIPGAVLIITKN